MGCGASQSTHVANSIHSSPKGGRPDDRNPLIQNEAAFEEAHHPPVAQPEAGAAPEDVWLKVCDTLDVPKGAPNPYKDLVVRRTNWKTIRIFVSSTFKDFHREREILVKEVFPDLRAWCENRRLHLVDCDLRWGVPKDSTTELTLRTCLGEIDRCYQDNIMPYFINMTSERIGWIPEADDVPHSLVQDYRWIFGLSVTEMEIVHGAYRKDNPNSIFLIRDESYLGTLPQEHRPVFQDENPVAPAKIKVLKQMIEDRFPKNRIISYKCEYDECDPQTNRVRLKVDDKFKQSVFNFFKDRISVQYPLNDDAEDIFQHMHEGHESFMKAKAEMVLGRGDILDKIKDYVDGRGRDVPLILLGGPGTGKSSIMARAVDATLTAAIDRKIPGGGGKPWYVFYHFVGAVPGSTSLQTTLQRLLKETAVCNDENLPHDMDSISQMTCSALNNVNTRPTVVFIDAVNQFDKEKHAEMMTWVPRKLGPNIRCIFSMIDDTQPHKSLRSREAKPEVIVAEPLSMSIRKDIINEFLGKFNKKLDMDQMIALLGKQSSENPLWLSIACEELRVYGEFRKINDKINTLADGLLELLQQVLARFEEEGGGHLLVATLCLLEVSQTGLLESELLKILADEDNIMPPTDIQEKGSKEASEKETHKPLGNLPAFKWAAVYRSLRPFLRPFGDSGEGRLDFYHRSLSKAVRKKYLKVEDAETSGKLYHWWHKKLADFFSHVENIKRKVEEYPHHLLYLKDLKRLEEFLGDWRVFDILFDTEYSPQLMLYWREFGAERMMDCYSEKLREITSRDELSQRSEKVARLMTQMGLYDQALNLGKQAVEIEEKELGSREKRMGDLYSMMAHIWDQKVKTFNFVDENQLPMEKETISNCRKAIDVYRKLSKDKHYNLLLAKQLIRLAFSLASWNDCGGDDELSAKDALKQGEKAVDEAIQIADKLNDKGTLAEAYMTKAVLVRYKHEEQMKWYNKSKEVAYDCYGQYHILCSRIALNTGIAHEDRRQYEQAYDLFKLSYEINIQLFGDDHPKTKRSLGILHEYFYAPIARRRGDKFPPPPPDHEY